MRRVSLTSACGVCCLIIGFGGCAERPTPVNAVHPAAATETDTSAALDGRVTRAPAKIEVISAAYDIDRPYLPMMGPHSSTTFRLQEGGPAELLWITGAHVRVVDGNAQEPLSDEYLCRAELTLDAERHRTIFGYEGDRSSVVLALGGGQLDLEFPAGFGIPIWSDESLTLTTQAQNPDFSPGQKPVQIRKRVTLDLVCERDLPQPLRPLYLCVVPGLKSLESRAIVYDDSDEFPDEALKLSASSPGVAFVNSAVRGDRFVRRFTDHWQLDPGREVNHTRVTTLLDLPADLAIHFVAAHLHPFAESVELKDLSAGEAIFHGLGAKASADGLPLLAGHEYELTSVYNNTSRSERNAMATLQLYLLDTQFKLPESPPAAER